MATLPEGFVLDQKAQPSLPAGFVIDAAPQVGGIDSDILAQAQRKNPQFVLQRHGDVTDRIIEPALTMFSGAVAEPVAGVIGSAVASIPGTAEGSGAGVAEAVRENLTFQPRTKQGQEGLQSLGEFVEPVTSSLSATEKALGDFTFEVTGSPALAAGATAIPAALIEALGLGAIKKLKPGSKLLTPEGRPTRLLDVELDKKGLVFDNLSPQARAAIPETAPKGLIPGGKEVRSTSEAIIVNQLEAGAKDNSLAGLKVVNGRIAPDLVGVEAIKQGFDAGFVQAVKTASPQSRAAMKKMLDITQRIKSNTRLGLDVRPGNVVGDSLSKRITYIRDQANAANAKLDQLANTNLNKLFPSTKKVETQLNQSLGNLDIEIIDGPNGVPKPVFKGSMISKDKRSQKLIVEAIDLLSEGGKPSALRMHKLKRQLDQMIDFKKKGAGGLSKAGEKVLRDLRASLNDSIREVSPAYAEVNDVLSKSLTALDDFQSVVGTKIDIFGEGADSIIGQKMRGLMSNISSRVNLENSVNQLNDVAADLGGVFGDDIKDLAMFANSIEDRFGAIAQTSFKGEIESAINQAGQQGVKATILQAGIDKVAKGSEKLRGINDFNAFQAMYELINRK